MKAAEHLVSVVIPAYNAGKTIDETLRSVRSQSHCHLEIIVVDDGSVDDTITVAKKHAAQDCRIRIVRQKNEGVAAARNRGWQDARAELIAFIDADDLWAPTKIERQLEALVSAGEQIGLVYSWYVLIDGESRVIMNGEPAYCAGDVLDHIFAGNFIGNGSAVLVRRQALLAANGFESGLHRAGAQGCEDLLFYCRVAETYHFAVVPDYLIGYRYLPENMSSNLPRMIRSWMLVIDEMIARYPDRAASLHSGLRNYGSWVLVRALRSGQFIYFARSLCLLFQRDPRLALNVLLSDLPQQSFMVVKRRLLALRKRERKPGLFFSIGNPG